MWVILLAMGHWAELMDVSMATSRFFFFTIETGDFSPMLLVADSGIAGLSRNGAFFLLQNEQILT